MLTIVSLKTKKKKNMKLGKIFINISVWTSIVYYTVTGFDFSELYIILLAINVFIGTYFLHRDFLIARKIKKLA
jgi:hypothetical protein